MEKNMELREIVTFLEVARQNSFSKAAKKLGYSQAAVTIQIKQLEQELGVLLFDRIGKQTTLTYQGSVFYKYGVEVVRGLEQAKTAVTDSGELAGKLRIGAVESICASVFPQLLQEYHRLHPKVHIEIVTDTPGVLLEKVRRNELDFVYLTDERIYDNKLLKGLEEAEEVCFVASTEHPLFAREKVRLEEVICEPFILTEKHVSYRYTLDRYLAAEGLEIVPFLEIGNTDYIIRQLVNNEGLSFLPKFAVRHEIEKGRLGILKVEGFHMSIWRQIIYHKDKWVTREMEGFFRLAQNHTLY